MRQNFLVLSSLIFIELLTVSSLQAAARDKSVVRKSNRLTNEPSGVISFEKTMIDFGTVKRGEKLRATFNFKNKGQGPLTIQGIQAACDCTTSESIKGKLYSPGERGTIEVVFDTKDYSGRISKALTVITNERSMSDRTLVVAATVNSEITASPPLADFGDVILKQSPEQIIRIKGNMKQELRVERVKFNQDNLDVSYRKEGRDFIVSIKLKSNAPIGFFKDTIWIKNNSTALPDMQIPVRATIRGEIGLTPAYVEFGSVPASQKSTRKIILNSPTPFDITDNHIEMNVNGSKTTLASNLLKVEVARKSKNEKNVTLELKNPGSQPGSVHGKITLETSNPQQKSLTFDFYAFFR
jgi:hypothetical protein